MKDLYLITTGYPYPAKSMETYLETEVKYYGVFRQVHILSMGVRRNLINQRRDVPGKNVEVHPIIFGSKLYYICNGFRAFLDVNFYKELHDLITSGRFSIKRLIRLIIYISRSHSDLNKIVKTLNLDKTKKIKDAVLYSYRFEYQPYVMYLLSRYFDNPKMIARAHRYDLYEERNSDHYIPMRKLLIKELDEVCLISEDGKKYLSAKYPAYEDKFSVERLGTTDICQKSYRVGGGVFFVTNCKLL